MVYSRAPKSHYIFFYASLAQRKSQSKEMNNTETNENMHSNSTRAKFVKVDWTFELLWDPLLTISPNLFFWKQLTVRSLQSK